MKSLPAWFEAYSISHQNNNNRRLHAICVPAIVFSIVGMFWGLPELSIFQQWQLSNFTLAWIVPLAFTAFYWRLSKVMLSVLLVQIAFYTVLCAWLSYHQLPVFAIALCVFIVAWIGQFIGHQIEGAKPSFIEDLQFLMIGPAWVTAPLLERLHITY